MHKDMLREITPAEGWDEVWNSDVTRSSQKPGQGCVVSNFIIFSTNSSFLKSNCGQTIISTFIDQGIWRSVNTSSAGGVCMSVFHGRSILMTVIFLEGLAFRFFTKGPNGFALGISSNLI